MVKTTKQTQGMLVKKHHLYEQDRIEDISAVKKDEIVRLISEGSQLTLLGILIQQIGDKIELDTPEFTQAKEIFAKIQGILAE